MLRGWGSLILMESLSATNFILTPTTINNNFIAWLTIDTSKNPFKYKKKYQVASFVLSFQGPEPCSTLGFVVQRFYVFLANFLLFQKVLQHD